MFSELEEHSIPYLEQVILSDEDLKKRLNGFVVLQRIGPECIPIISEGLELSDPRLRLAAIESLEKLQKEAAPAMKCHHQIAEGS